MDIGVKRVGDFKTNLWSGGTTTELGIYPQESKYVDRDFVWRLSSATVELEESDFTALPDYDRVLIVLEGQVKLIHQNVREVVLNELEQDSFSGSYVTKSIGKIKDFNLMFKKGNYGFAQVIDLEKEQFNCEIPSENEFQFKSESFYCVEGTCNIMLNGENIDLSSGELFVATGKESEFENISVFGKGKVIRACVHFA